MLAQFQEALRLVSGGASVALATVVRARGSTPQKTGAAMLITPAGQTLGTLGGGCVEAETRKRALELLGGQSAKPVTLIPFKLDQDFGWDDGVVCGGIMDIAVEIISPNQNEGFDKVRQLMERLSRREAGEYSLTIGHDRFSFPIEPAPRLVIAGAGHVGQALAQMAGLSGFEVTVIDDRPDMASAERFPHARRMIGSVESELSRLAIDPFTYVVIVTRGHKNDGQALAAVIHSTAKYLGLIGSKRKIRTILDSLHQQGVPIDILLRVHAPIGLDIGAISPQEIAVSICAELVSLRRGVIPPNSMKFPREELLTYFHRDTLGDGSF